MSERIYLAIDLKSFYASVECRERQLDPMTTHLVVADKSRTEKTICLAVSPSLKAYGIPGRARLFQVAQKVREINAARRLQARGIDFAEPPSMTRNSAPIPPWSWITSQLLPAWLCTWSTAPGSTASI